MTKQQVHLMVGTRKGGFVLRSDQDRKQWSVDGPMIPGWSIYHMAADARDRRTMFAAANNDWFGAAVHISHDLGRTWNQAKNSPKFDKRDGRTVKRYWHLAAGHKSQPNVVWCGVEPASLFRSADHGETWKPVKGINEHPSRDKWQPGAGGLCLHTIIPDAKDANRMFVAISAGGAFCTDNAGKRWLPINTGVHADFSPGPPPQVGH